MSQQIQQKAGPWPTYRPIAPSNVPPKILPRPDDGEKRKWSATFDESLNGNKSRGMFLFLLLCCCCYRQVYQIQHTHNI